MYYQYTGCGRALQAALPRDFGLRDGGGGLLTLKEGTLYPILYRLEDDGRIRSAWQTPDGALGSPKTSRKVYTITRGGPCRAGRADGYLAAVCRLRGEVFTGGIVR